MKANFVKSLTGLVALLLASACTPNASDFARISGYDAQGNRTGSFLPGPITLTPY